MEFVLWTNFLFFKLNNIRIVVIFTIILTLTIMIKGSSNSLVRFLKTILHITIIVVHFQNWDNVFLKNVFVLFWLLKNSSGFFIPLIVFFILNFFRGYMYIHQSSKYSYRMEEDLHTGAKKNIKKIVMLIQERHFQSKLIIYSSCSWLTCTNFHYSLFLNFLNKKN